MFKASHLDHVLSICKLLVVSRGGKNQDIICQPKETCIVACSSEQLYTELCISSVLFLAFVT